MSIIYFVSPYRFLMNRMIKTFSNTLGRGKKILELGAGPYTYKSFFCGSKVTSTDLVHGRNIDEIADVTNLKYGSGVFDVVLCFNVLEHVYNAPKGISEIHRVLKTGGSVVIIVPFLYPIHDPPYDFYRFTEYSLKTLLNKFSTVEIESISILPFWIFKRFVLFYFVKAIK